MIIFPAIDLFKGNAVRLLKGNYDDMIIYSENPLEVAKKFEKEGATHIHLVDLEGANLEMYSMLTKKFQMNITASGGIYTIDDIEVLQNMGLYGAIIGKAYYTGAIDLKEAIEVTK